MSLSKQEFTNAGRDMLGAAQAGALLSFPKIVVGSGTASAPSDLWPLTALITHEMDVTISRATDLGGGVMIVEGNFKSSDAPHAFYLRELGIMAHTSVTPTDRLYSVANVFADPPDYIDPAAPTIQSFKIKLIVDRVDPDDISVTIAPSEAIMGENVGAATVGPGPFKESAGNILKFKRFVAGDGIELIEAPDPEDDANTIEIRARILKTNVDLYVPATYPGITDPDVLFDTVQDAHDYLLQFRIPSDKLATIHVYSGHFANTIPITFTHPDAERIAVTGLPIIAKTCTGNLTRTGTLPNIDVTVNVSGGTTEIAVNDVVYLYDSPYFQFESCGIVTAKTSSTVTIRMRIYNVNSPASSYSVLGTTKLLVFPTQFTSSMSGQTPIFSCPNGINKIKNFGCRSTSALNGTAISILGGLGAIEHVIAHNFSIGFTIGASVNFTPVVAANACNVGMEVGPSGDVFLMGANPVGGWQRFAWSGNVVYGLWVAGGSYVSAGQNCVTYANSNSTGIRSDTRGWVGCGQSTGPNGGFVIGANVKGCVAALLGIIQSALGSVSLIYNNTDLDFQAMGGGQITVSHDAVVPPNSQMDPDNFTLGPSGGYIEVNP
jgi:hypothetical protein